ncbi:PglZ domain-containing protein [Candidatus Halocynthiibacter alkanivorans]|uniref:PglZ domain-containing protein n=1 Tax=Candidatus Halocynthiibacter alkanivorans TaxID=2267619 RepID=UPI001359A0AA|nr:PglZ domain-containing protein [Candidatus Halocynthiibacter alkanivorans]
MSHQLHNHLAAHLDKALQQDRVVVFYDARSEFEPFIKELKVVGAGVSGVQRVCIGETLTHMAQFDGSFFALKASIEPLISADKPEALLIYVPGRVRDLSGSVLMEVERAGQVYGDAPSHALKSIAQRLLREEYTDGNIDEMLRPDSLNYEDVVRFLGQGSSGNGSLVKLVLSGSSSEDLITDWIVSEDKDDALASKLAEPELFRLIHARLGLEIEGGTPLAKARRQTVRYLLVNEFRSDLGGDAPDALTIVPTPGHNDESKHIGAIARALRGDHADVYVFLADDIESEFDLANADIDPARLGAIDTFRFEERRLLLHAANLITDGHYAQALGVVAGRRRSFWVDHPGFLGRLAQWEACRLMAELGAEVETVRPELKKAPAVATKWVEAYAQGSGWHRVDRAQRTLEAWVATMEDDPEEPLERALALARRNHEALISDMAKGFTGALTASSWSTPGVLHQSHIYPELVEPCGGRVAYFFVDAMRFEMGADLVDQLTGAQELRLQPAVAALPSITPIGMAALLPGASSSFSVVEHKGQLASRIGDSVLPAVRERLKLLRAARPDFAEILLDDLLLWTSSRVGKKLGSAPLVVVRSQEIDAFGESGHELAARQVMDSIIGNISRAVRKLSKLGVEQFVITSDHGHQFSVRKAEDMMMDRPGGNEVDQHRRCWAGHGGQTPTAAVRVSGAELGYQTDLEFIFPQGLAVFKAGGDLAFHHGGCSLQEIVVPVITLRMPLSQVPTETASKVVVEGYPSKLTNRTFGCRVIYTEDMFDQEVIAARVLLIGDGQEVGRAGMAPDVEFDRATATVQLLPRKMVSIGMMLTKETSKKVRIVVQDPATDAVLAQSEEIEVGELI